MLKGIDTIVVDLQDVGVRFYTFPTTVAYVMEEAAKRQIKVVVLDRPNPVNGWQIEGPTLDTAAVGFTGYLPSMPIRHGLTIGELARLYNGEAHIGCDLDVVAMKGWARSEWFDDTGLEWINPSPNMRNLVEATLYPGIGMLEYANLSVGRGTDTPFEQIGAPWIDGRALADAVSRLALPGVRVYPVRFTPTSSTFAGQACQGIFFVVTDREALRPVRLGAEIAAILVRLYGASIDFGRSSLLVGSSDAVAALRAGQSAAAVARRRGRPLKSAGVQFARDICCTENGRTEVRPYVPITAWLNSAARTSAISRTCLARRSAPTSGSRSTRASRQRKDRPPRRSSSSIRR